MNKAKVERPRRFQIRRNGELIYEEHRFICLIHDISEKGIFLICNYYLEIGQEFAVRFEFEPGLNFEAKIRISHFSDGCFGAEIIEVDPRSNSNWNQFLKNNYADQLRLPERRVRR